MINYVQLHTYVYNSWVYFWEWGYVLSVKILLCTLIKSQSVTELLISTPCSQFCSRMPRCCIQPRCADFLQRHQSFLVRGLRSCYCFSTNLSSPPAVFTAAKQSFGAILNIDSRDESEVWPAILCWCRGEKVSPLGSPLRHCTYLHISSDWEPGRAVSSIPTGCPGQGGLHYTAVVWSHKGRFQKLSVFFL